MPKFRFVGEVESVFPDVQRLDGRTLCAVPGEVVVLATDPHSALLVPVADDKAKGDLSRAEVTLAAAQRDVVAAEAEAVTDPS